MVTNSVSTCQKKHRIGLETSDVCPICAREVEDNFHPFLRCQLGRDLYLNMAKVWNLPRLQTITNCGKEWLLQLLAPRSDMEWCMILLVFWRAWYTRNEVVHYKPVPQMDVSVRYLQSYLASLMAIKNDSGADLVKGKTYITMDKRGQSDMHTAKLPGWEKP